MYNRIILMGRLTKDPQENKGSVTICLAVDRPYKSKETNEKITDFIYATAFGKTADIIKDYVKKGDMLHIEGNIINNNYTNDKGETILRNSVIINTIQLLPNKNKIDYFEL